MRARIGTVSIEEASASGRSFFFFSGARIGSVRDPSGDAPETCCQSKEQPRRKRRGGERKPPRSHAHGETEDESKGVKLFPRNVSVRS